MLCWLPSSFFFFCLLPCAVLSISPDSQLLKKQTERRTSGGIHVPLLRKKNLDVRQGEGQAGGIGLGDFRDVTYNVLMKIGSVETALVLDTGSADLWVISDACTGNCSTQGVPLYPQATFQPTGLDAKLLYGDSSTGTHAYGPIGKDTVGLAGLTMDGQYFAAVNSTNTSVMKTGSAGIFGLGFPINSVIWKQIFYQTQSSGSTRLKREPRAVSPRFLFSKTIQNYVIRFFPRFDFLRPIFSTFPDPLFDPAHSRRQSVSSVSDILSSYASLGPFLSRFVAQGLLAAPMVTVTLQRDTVDIGGNLGMLAVGELPVGIENGSLTWAQVRGYPVAQGGLAAPADSPNEIYPIAWEIPLDDVYLDGQKLPRSTLSSSNISLSALIDTGNSLIRGPADVLVSITEALGGNENFPCSEPHTLAFEIGGKMFPVDPRDFATQVYQDSVNLCTSALAATDPPNEGGGYLYSWSLGDPFLKSVLASFYYGNLSYPSRDPARIGFLSTVPSNAAGSLQSAVAEASANGGNFPATSEPAPSGTLAGASTDTGGVPQAPSTISSDQKSSGSLRIEILSGWITSLSICYTLAMQLLS